MSRSKSPKKKKTWLWALGSLLMIPIPVTLMLRRKKENAVPVRSNITPVTEEKRLMDLCVTYSREDDINIGYEWSYTTEINGEPTGSEIQVAAGETLNFYARFTELDDIPDVGEATKSYTVTENDLTEGFTVSMDVSVTENGGRNKGESAHFVVTFAFSAK